MAEEWRSTTLSAVCVDNGLQTGPFGSQLHQEEYTTAGVPVIMPKDMVDCRVDTETIARISEEKASSLERHRCIAGDILFSRRGDIGRASLITGDEVGWLCGTGSLRARPRPGDIDPQFLIHAVTSSPSVAWLLEHAVGQTMLNLNTKTLGKLPLHLPPLAEQRKIAAILSSVDEAIEKTQAVIDQVQVVKKGLVQELLTRGLPGRHKTFKQTEIGRIPTTWVVGTIGDVTASCDYGLNEKLDSNSSGIPVLRMGNLQSGRVVLDDLKYLPEASFTRRDLTLRRGDILFNRTNSPELVGKVGIFDATRTASFASYLLRLRTNERAQSAWLIHVLNSDSVQNGLRALATPGVSQSNINRTKLLGYRIPIAPLEEQREIAQALSFIDQRAHEEHSYRDGLRTLKSALASLLLTGELRVRPSPEPA